jgi:phospholipid transport system substrate-binding protein
MGRSTMFCLAVLVVLVGAGALAAEPVTSPGVADDPRGLLQSKYEEIQRIVRETPEKDAMQERVRTVMDTYVDYRELGRQCLVGYWDSLKPAEREAYVTEFKTMIQRSYVKRFDAKKEFTVEFVGATAFEDKQARVRSVIRTGRSEAAVDYLLMRQPKGGWMAVDVVIDDVSWMKSYRKQFNNIMQKDGFTVLMDKLRKKNAKKAEE